MKILNLNQYNEKFGIRKVSIDDVVIDTYMVFPEPGKTLKQSLKTGMVVYDGNENKYICIT